MMENYQLTTIVVDVLISFAWFAAFGALVDAIMKNNCGDIWEWHSFNSDSMCDRWKAAEAFSFLSAVFWLVSTLLVCFFSVLYDLPLHLSFPSSSNC